MALAPEEKKLIVAVAHTIRHFRKAEGVSQEKLAERAGLDRTYVSGVERGVRNITLDSLEQIVIALGIDFHKFFSEVLTWMGKVQDEQ